MAVLPLPGQDNRTKQGAQMPAFVDNRPAAQRRLAVERQRGFPLNREALRALQARQTTGDQQGTLIAAPNAPTAQAAPAGGPLSAVPGLEQRETGTRVSALDIPIIGDIPLVGPIVEGAAEGLKEVGEAVFGPFEEIVPAKDPSDPPKFPSPDAGPTATDASIAKIQTAANELGSSAALDQFGQEAIADFNTQMDAQFGQKLAAMNRQLAATGQSGQLSGSMLAGINQVSGEIARERRKFVLGLTEFMEGAERQRFLTAAKMFETASTLEWQQAAAQREQLAFRSDIATSLSDFFDQTLENLSNQTGQAVNATGAQEKLVGYMAAVANGEMSMEQAMAMVTSDLQDAPREDPEGPGFFEMVGDVAKAAAPFAALALL